MAQYELISDVDNERLDKFLSRELTELSRSYIQKLLKEQHILVNGKAVKANYKLSREDSIQVSVPDSEPLDIVPEDIPLDILYDIRTGEAQQVVVSLQLAGNITKTLPPEVCFRQAVLLYHGAHRTVQYQDALTH